MNKEHFSKQLQQDLKKKLTRLCLMHNEPALHVAEYFAELKSQVDYEAEVAIASIHLNQDDDETCQIGIVNQTRQEFIRILQELEKRTTSLQAKPQTTSSEAFSYLEQKIDAFGESSVDLDHLEDSYVQLASEIIDETDRVEQRIFGDQTIIYWPSTDKDRLGSLVYFSDLFLNRSETDHFLSKANVFLNHLTQHRQSFATKFFMPLREKYELSKNKLAIDNLSMADLRKFTETSKFFYVGKTKEDYTGGSSAEESSVDREFVSSQYQHPECYRRAGGIHGLSDSVRLFEFCSSENCRLTIENARLNGLPSNLLPSPIDRLVSLSLEGVHLESFDSGFLVDCVNIKQLKLRVTFSKGVKFDLAFLAALTKLQTLELSLADARQDFSVLDKLTQLNGLKLESSSFFYAEEFPLLSKNALKQIFSMPRLQSLELSRFDIETFDREMLSSCSRLETLKLAQNRFKEETCMNLGFPLCLENAGKNARLHYESPPRTCLKMLHSGIRNLNTVSFAGMTHLMQLSLSGNLIAELPLAVFQDMRYLERLELDNNLIRHIKSGVFGKLDKLATLTLDQNPIESIEANAFCQLDKLTELSMKSCRLKSIDSEMFNGLKSLKILDLDNNLIERIEVVVEDGQRINVAKANLNDEEKDLVKKHLFKDFSSLLKLKLSKNKLEKLDFYCFSNLKSLNQFDLSSNKILQLSGGSGGLNSRLALQLADNQLTTIDKDALPKTVFHLNLSKNRLKQLDDNFFAEFSRLLFLNLAENELTMKITEATFASCRHCLLELDFRLNESILVAEGAFREMQTLRFLQFDFSRHFDSLSLLKELRIRRLTPLILLSLQKLCIDESGFNQLQACILSNCSIKSLTRDPQWQSKQETPETDYFNLSWLPMASNIYKLDLSKNLIETLDDPKLFVDLTKICAIDLSGNRLIHIHRDVFKCLAELERIDLSDNRLSSIDMGLFRHLTSLRHLDLSSNNISFINLARLFRLCTRLQSLNLADNQLDDRSTAEPIDARTCAYVLKLDMANNRLEKMDFVRDIHRLQHLNLRGNRIESIMSNNGENMLGRLLMLTHLNLSGNQICSLTDEMFVHLRGKLEQLDITGNPADFQSLNNSLIC